MKKEEIEQKIESIEKEMQDPNFWENKHIAQKKVKELNELKKNLSGADIGASPAVISILSGAGGVDAEDFSRMLFEMYRGFIEKKGWNMRVLHSNENEHGGYRNISFEIPEKNAFGLLRSESGVHRLVRLSSFNAKKQRHTSFSMVEVIPKLKDIKNVNIPESDLKVEFSKSGGPGGQNVNKRETAVRIIHIPTNISVHVDSERTQERNREIALEVLKSKLLDLKEKEGKEKIEELSISKNTSIEWGNQIRSYVLHPYKIVKDHRTDIEESDADSVLEGDIEKFLV